ncbi:MAG: DUF4215 domain-containing protein [Deltaproteobacteria bacterium]|nr:DUF4215 domain-containing protein [Deltaproteobacteria bacterium]
MKKLKWVAILFSVCLLGGAGCSNDDDCGNGIVDAGEQCDDGNDINDDACSNTCELPADVCGDGILSGDEACDDGNNIDGDGCENDCTVTVSEETYEETGLGLAITDDQLNEADPFDANSTCVTLNVPSSILNALTDVNVTFGIAHTQVSDLFVGLKSPNNTQIGLLVSVPSNAELIETSEITFDEEDANAVSGDLIGSGLMDNEVACQDDGQCVFKSYTNAFSTNTLADFNGEDPAGDWLLCVADQDAMETGTLETARLKLTRTVSQ